MNSSSQEGKRKKKITELKTFSVPFSLEEIEENITITTNTPTQPSKEELINQALKYNAQGLKIQDARVFAKKDSFGRFKPGIYRVSTKGSKSGTFIKPLFRFITPKPKVRKKNVTFYDILTQETLKELPLIFERNLKKYGM